MNLLSILSSWCLQKWLWLLKRRFCIFKRSALETSYMWVSDKILNDVKLIFHCLLAQLNDKNKSPNPVQDLTQIHQLWNLFVANKYYLIWVGIFFHYNSLHGRRIAFRERISLYNWQRNVSFWCAWMYPHMQLSGCVRVELKSAQMHTMVNTLWCDKYAILRGKIGAIYLRQTLVIIGSRHPLKIQSNDNMGSSSELLAQSKQGGGGAMYWNIWGGMS